jgi:hypothetical protein
MLLMNSSLVSGALTDSVSSGGRVQSQENGLRHLCVRKCSDTLIIISWQSEFPFGFALSLSLTSI